MRAVQFIVALICASSLLQCSLVTSSQEPWVRILHPAPGQKISSEWQSALIVSVSGFSIPTDGILAVYIDDRLALRVDNWPVLLRLPQLPDGEHSIAASLQTINEGDPVDVVAESVTEVTYAFAADGPGLWHFDYGFDNTDTETYREMGNTRTLQENAEVQNAREPLTVIWTTPEWEEDWISELLQGGGVAFTLVKDKTFSLFPKNALVAVSQNDERQRPAEVLARYLLGFRERGCRVGVLHMSDEDYTADTYFYPWVHYVIRNHFQEELVGMGHVLAIPLGYKKGFWDGEHRVDLQARWEAVDAVGDREFTWNFVGQTHDKPTRKSMLSAAERVPGGFSKLTSFWGDPSGLSTEEFRALLLKSRFTLCPRGFVHPESFRLSEALEAGSIPIIEEDDYFLRLLGPDHPLPTLAPPKGCPVPRTTKYHQPPHPQPECADVWPGVEALMRGEWAREWAQKQAEVVGWWRGHKLKVKESVGRIVRHGSRWRGEWGGEGGGVEGGREEGEGEGVSGEGAAGGAGAEGAGEEGRCGHHDLACVARKAEREGRGRDAVLHAAIEEARRKAGALFSADSEEGGEGRGGGRGAGLWERGGAAREVPPREELEGVGGYPAGRCDDDCDCAGADACEAGRCVEGEGRCERYAGEAVNGKFAEVLVVNMNGTDVDRARWRRAQLQLGKYGVKAERHAGVDGKAMTSAALQDLLDRGVISPLHDSLVMDGRRSVLGCALVHLEIMERAVVGGNAWTLILEDDFLLPPHFPRVLEHAWSALPPHDSIDLLYLGVGSNNRAPLQWLNRRVFRPAQTVGTHAFAVTAHGAERILLALRPLHQSIDSQIHETLLHALNVLAFASPDPPPGVRALLPYPDPPSDFPPERYSFTLSEPAFFPAGSFYHGLLSVDPRLPSTIPRDTPLRPQEALPAAFFLRPLNGDVLHDSAVSLEFVTHNFPMWLPDGSEPPGRGRGYAALRINGSEVLQCAQRVCGVLFQAIPDGPAAASVWLHGPGGEIVLEGATVEFSVCARGEMDCSLGVCECVPSSVDGTEAY